MMWIRRCCTGAPEPHKIGAFSPPTFQRIDYSKSYDTSETTAVSTPPLTPQTSYSTSQTRPIPWVHATKFHDNYELRDELGKGAHAVVHSAYRRNDGTTTNTPQGNYAVKVVQRTYLNRKQLVAFKDECQILANLQHPHILRLHELYKEPGYFFVVLEQLHGGELFDRLCDKTTYTEVEARNVCRIIFEAMAFCHSHKVAHRDLKPENLLLKNKWDDFDVTIADFGFAKYVVPPHYLTTRCGSPAYTAPEIINYIPYSERCDNWSLGVIVFTVLGGYPPFYQSTVHATFQQIRQAAYQFHPERWDHISKEAKRFIRALLTVDPNQRMTSAEALEHSWMTGRGNDVSLAQNLKRLKQYNVERKEPRHPLGPVKTASYYWLVSRR